MALGLFIWAEFPRRPERRLRLVKAIGHAAVRAVRRRQGCGCVKHWSATAACYAAPIVSRVFRD